MKLASALTERSDLQRKVTELTRRLSNNAKVQEGDRPAEEPALLLAELDGVMSRLEELVTRINLTNSIPAADGHTMTELLSRRDCLKQKIRILRGFLDNTSCRVERYSKTEIKINSTVSVSELQKKLDDLSKELRELNERIQEQNWLTELK